MILTNKEIYDYAICLRDAFGNSDIILPVKINFFLQKNIMIISTAASEIESMRLAIAKQFGHLSEDGSSYVVESSVLSEARLELESLFSLTQDLNIHTFSIDDFDSVSLTYQQMQAIMFMIEE